MDAKKTIARNKKARHDYLIEDTWEAGLVLSGTEVKALRMGRASLIDSWIEVKDGEAWLYGANIPMYAQGSWNNHAPTRKRKLLLHASEIERIGQKVQAKGYTSSAVAPKLRSRWPKASRNGTSASLCARRRISVKLNARCAPTRSDRTTSSVQVAGASFVRGALSAETLRLLALR